MLVLFIPVPIFLISIIIWNQCLSFGELLGVLAGVFSYIGATILSLFIYYNTWVKEKIQERIEEVSIEISPSADFNNESFVPYLEEKIAKYKYKFSTDYFEKTTKKIKNNYLHLNISNKSHYTCFTINLAGIYYVDNDKVSTVKDYTCKSDADLKFFIDYKQTVSIFAGCDETILKRDYMQMRKFFNVFLVFKLTDNKFRTKYLIVDYVLGQTLGIQKEIISSEEYTKRMKSANNPIKLTNYNKQFFKKV